MEAEASLRQSARHDAPHVYTRMEAEASLRQSARHDAPHVYTRMEAEASLRQSGQRKATRGAVTGAVPGAVPGGGGGVGGVLGGGGMAVAEHSAHKHRWPQGMRACVRSRSWHTTHVVCALAPSWAPSAPETAPMDPPIPK